jgi:hypothetical protein
MEILRTIDLYGYIMKKIKKEQHLYDYLKDDIVKKTGFKKSKIELHNSKRSNKNIPVLDQHEFVYERKSYILIGNDLKCIEKISI